MNTECTKDEHGLCSNVLLLSKIILREDTLRTYNQFVCHRSLTIKCLCKASDIFGFFQFMSWLQLNIHFPLVCRCFKITKKLQVNNCVTFLKDCSNTGFHKLNTTSDISIFLKFTVIKESRVVQLAKVGILAVKNSLMTGLKCSKVHKEYL